MPGFFDPPTPTPASIGAQPVDAGLTSLTDADSAAGLAHPSAANVWTRLSLASADLGIYTSSAGVLASFSLPSAARTALGSLTGTNTGDQTISLTGDVTGSGTGSFAATLATVPATKGGTGYASYAAGDHIYADTTTTLAKIAAPTSGQRVGKVWGWVNDTTPGWVAALSFLGLTAAQYSTVYGMDSADYGIATGGTLGGP